jgi:hypothetical protein
VYHKYQTVCPGIEHESPRNVGHATYKLTDVHIFDHKLAFVIHVSKTMIGLFRIQKYIFPYLFFFDRGKQRHQNLPQNRKQEREKARKTDRQRERNWCIEVHYSHMHANTCSGIQFL